MTNYKFQVICTSYRLKNIGTVTHNYVKILDTVRCMLTDNNTHLIKTLKLIKGMYKFCAGIKYKN